MDDCLVVYSQQKDAPTSSSGATAIKGFFEKFDATNDSGGTLMAGIAGKVILSGTGGMNEGVGVQGEVWNNGGGGSIATAVALRAFASCVGPCVDLFGLQMARLDGESATRKFAWGYLGSSSSLPTSYLDATDNLYIGASINLGGTGSTFPAVPLFTISSTGKLAKIVGVTGTAGTGDANGIKHIRVSGCTTGSTAGNTCDTTVNWLAAFADANYTATCTVDGPTNTPYVLYTKTKAAGSIVVTLATLTNAAATGTVNCIAMHD